jgi:PKD repeat protein
LARVDKATGAALTVGSPHPGFFLALEADASGRLYAADFATGTLYSVNQDTGELTRIGETGIDHFQDLALAPDGRLWALGGCSKLWTVEPATATATLQFTVDDAPSSICYSGLVIAADGRVYVTSLEQSSSLYHVDPSSHRSSLVGELGVDFPGGGDIAPSPESSPRCVPTPSGLIAWWKGEGDASDATGSYPGTLVNGVRFEPGKVGAAFSFDGDDDYVEVPDLLTELAGTMEFWVNRRRTGEPFSFSDVWAGGVDFSPEPFFELQTAPTFYTKDGYLLWDFANAAGNRTGSYVAEFQWHHLSMTWQQEDGTSTMRLYVDAQPVAETPGLHVYDLAPFLIGAYDPTSPNQFALALIDEFSVYDRALSASEIAGIHGAGTAGKCPPNRAPTANPGGPQGRDEGADVGFDGTGSFDPDGDKLSFSWDFGDGSTSTEVRPTHKYSDNGDYVVTLEVTDPAGATGRATTSATIANLPPVVTVPVAGTAQIDQEFRFSGSFADPGLADGPWFYTIDWGDGVATKETTTTQSDPVTGTHTYRTAGTYDVRFNVRDKDGDLGSAAQRVTVLQPNRPPAAVPGGPYAGEEAAAIAFDGSGSTDPDGDALAYAWDFGDGTTSTESQPRHAYADNGSHTVALTVTDARGAASGQVTTTVTVTNVAPVVAAEGAAVVTIGVPYSLAFSFSDPGSNDAPWRYAIDWGDGRTEEGSTSDGAAPIATQHAYSAAGQRTIRLSVSDKDRSTGVADVQVTVNTPPVASAGGPYVGSEGASIGFNGAGSSDADPGDVLTYSWDFGDGSTGAGVSTTHVYPDNGTYAVSLTVTDARGARGSASTMATVANVAPAGTFSSPTTVIEGSAIRLSFSATTEPSTADVAAGLQYRFDCGDGAGYGEFSPTALRNCPTLDEERTSRSVRGQVRDKDGGVSAEYTGQTSVANGAPTAELRIRRTQALGVEAAVQIGDPGAQDSPWKWEIAWGDKQTDKGDVTTVPASFSRSHLYTAKSCPAGATRTITLSVTDGDRAAGPATTATFTCR